MTKLSTITVEVNVNTGQYDEGMRRVGDTAASSLGRASSSAADFQTAFDRAALAVGTSAMLMANKFQAANDQIMSASKQTSTAIDGIGAAAARTDMSGWASRMRESITDALLSAGTSAFAEWTERTGEAVGEKVKSIGIGLAIGIVSATAAAVYTAYKVVSSSVGFVTGLFTGDAYKSDNIDAVITLNDEIKKLQDNLRIGAVEASALNEALKVSGSNATTYAATLNAATTASRDNTDELDRLGVKYTDANGKMLSQADILKNAKSVLDEYTEGYDRNAAAAAIGMGTYKEIADAVSITTDKIERAKERLIDYNLIIGEGSQEAVTAYQNAMRDFQRESDLSAQALKKAVADQIMPLLTDLAIFFKDGFPFVINAFRYSMATLTSLFYGLKEAAYVTSEAVIRSFSAMGDVVSRVVGAIAKAVRGDAEGAWRDLSAIPSDLGKQWGTFFANVRAQSEGNVKAMKLAWGGDTIAAASGKPDPTKPGPKKGKRWKSRPDDPAKGATSAPQVSEYERFLEMLDRMIEKTDNNVYAALRLTAAQKAQREGLEPILAYQKIDALQNAENLRAINTFTTKLEEENSKLMIKREAIGIVGTALEVYILREERRAKLEAEINRLTAEGKPLTDANREALIQKANASAAAAEAILRENQAIERSFDVGAKRALAGYLDDAENAAKSSEKLFATAFQGMEESLAAFVRTGKLDFSSLANSIIADLARITIRENVTGPLARWMLGSTSGGSSGGLGGILPWLLKAGSALSGWFGGSSIGPQGYEVPGSGPSAPVYGGDLVEGSFASGIDYVPRDMIAQIHKGERVVPAAQNTSNDRPIHITVNVSGNQSAPDVRRSAGQGAREALAVMLGARRYA